MLDRPGSAQAVTQEATLNAHEDCLDLAYASRDSCARPASSSHLAPFSQPPLRPRASHAPLSMLHRADAM